MHITGKPLFRWSWDCVCPESHESFGALLWGWSQPLWAVTSRVMLGEMILVECTVQLSVTGLEELDWETNGNRINIH